MSAFRSIVFARFRAVLPSICIFAGLASVLLGDGGSIMFRESEGPFIITLFAASVPLRVGLSDLSVMVEDGSTHVPLLDADVALILRSPEGSENVLKANRAQATNKLLYSVAPNFPVPGTWNITVRVRQQARNGEAGGNVSVLAANAALWNYWPYFAIVPLLVTLFVLHHRLARDRISAYRDANRRPGTHL